MLQLSTYITDNRIYIIHPQATQSKQTKFGDNKNQFIDE